MGGYRTRKSYHIREGNTITDVYVDISPFYGMAPATRVGIDRLGGAAAIRLTARRENRKTRRARRV